MIAASITLSAAVVHFSWSRAASIATDQLLNTLEMQITQMVRRTWWEQVVEIQNLSQVMGQSLENLASNDARRTVLLSLLRSAPKNVWLVSGRSGGGLMAAGPIGPSRSAVVSVDKSGRVGELVEVGTDKNFSPSLRSRANTVGTLSAFDWKQFAPTGDEPRWEILRTVPVQNNPGLTYVQKTNGAFNAIAIDYQTLAGILGGIPVAGGGRSFILGDAGQKILAAEKADALYDGRLDEVAKAAGEQIGRRKPQNKNVDEHFRVSVGGSNYAVAVSPLWFHGWQLAVIVPDGEFLYSVNQTYRYVPFVIIALTLVAVAATMLLGFLIFRKPIETIISNLQLVQRFQLDRVTHHRSYFRELDQISDAIARMSLGLASFAKFIPVDVVQSLLSQGIQPRPGGSQKTITVLFTDIAGFTAMTERLGEAVLPQLSDYLELASREVGQESGTIDKFIGDSVMAFWGAPLPDRDQVVRACRSALAIVSGVPELRRNPSEGTGIQIRIGLETGNAIVGYVGSPTRLNYTAIGDVVNIASRIENLNKYYGTSFLIGEQARLVAGDAIHVREVDRAVLPGRSTAIAVFEPLGMSVTDSLPLWVKLYETGLQAYRNRCFVQAIAYFDELLLHRPFDGPAKVIRDKCIALVANPPGMDWRAITVLPSKM